MVRTTGKLTIHLCRHLRILFAGSSNGDDSTNVNYNFLVIVISYTHKNISVDMTLSVINNGGAVVLYDLCVLTNTS